MSQGVKLPQAVAQTRAAADAARAQGLVDPAWYRDITDGTVTPADKVLGNLMCTTLETNILQNPRVGRDMQAIKARWQEESAPYLEALRKHGPDHPATKRAEARYMDQGGSLFSRYIQSGKLDPKTAAALRAADDLSDAINAQSGAQGRLQSLFDFTDWTGQLGRIWDLTEVAGQ